VEEQRFRTERATAEGMIGMIARIDYSLYRHR